MKSRTSKVEFTFIEEDGRKVIKTLECAEAEKWRKWMESVCTLAWTHGKNPPRDELQWQVRDVTENSEDVFIRA